MTSQKTEEDAWTTVGQESATQVELETGETFTGIKVADGEPFESNGKTVPVYQFTATGDQGGEEGVKDGELCSFIGSYKLLCLADIPEGNMVRITRFRDVPMNGNGRQPMKDYQVQSKPGPAASR
jgi:hypothetical protein